MWAFQRQARRAWTVAWTVARTPRAASYKARPSPTASPSLQESRPTQPPARGSPSRPGATDSDELEPLPDEVKASSSSSSSGNPENKMGNRTGLGTVNERTPISNAGFVGTGREGEAGGLASRSSRESAAAEATTAMADDEEGHSDGAMSSPRQGGTERAGGGHDWSKSFHGLSDQPFSKEVGEILMAPLDPKDIEIKPDGIIYLPEIKYRRILNRAFGPGGWGMAPRGESNVGTKYISREYALVVQGRLVSIARGEQEYFDQTAIPTAIEGVKSNALMRCCKDLGVGSEMWDPRFIKEYKKKYAVEVFAEHQGTKKRRKLWRRKEDTFSYPYQEL